MRIQLKLNAALLSHCPSVLAFVTGVTSHISHIYTGINAMLIIRGPIKSYIHIALSSPYNPPIPKLKTTDPFPPQIRGKDLAGAIKVMPMGLDAAIKKRQSGEFKSEVGWKHFANSTRKHFANIFRTHFASGMCSIVLRRQSQ